MALVYLLSKYWGVYYHKIIFWIIVEKEVVEIYLYQSKNQQISLYFTLDMYVLKLNIQDTRATSVEADLVF